MGDEATVGFAPGCVFIGCGCPVEAYRFRRHFTSRFISTGPSISDRVTLLAATDWEAAVTALHAGELPASGGERRMLLLAASIAAGTPVSLNDALPGIDRRTAGLVVKAIAHATGHAARRSIRLSAPSATQDRR